MVVVCSWVLVWLVVLGVVCCVFVWCLLFVVCCVLCVVCCVLSHWFVDNVVVCWSLFVVRCSLFVVRCLPVVD